MLRFAKYHGLGNDFVVVNGLVAAPALAAEQVRALCDRHRGIGADGVLTVRRAAGADARMQVQNADGSDSSQCGNGLRCVARFLYDEGLVPSSRGEVVIAAGEATYAVRRLSASRFLARMGRAVFSHAELPAAAQGVAELVAEGRRFAAVPVHLGNPHAVIFGDDAPRPLAERYGQPLEHDPGFLARANVSFARRAPGGFEAVVWERGDGITQACGSGACAIGAAAVERGLWRRGEPMDVRLPGGVLRIVVGENGEIELEGEAVRVFTGEVPLP